MLISENPKPAQSFNKLTAAKENLEQNASRQDNSVMSNLMLKVLVERKLIR